MRVKMGFVAAIAALALIVPMTGHALTSVAQCTPDFGTSCTVTFICPVHTVNLRAEVAFDFVGIVDVQISDSLPADTVTHSSEWIGRAQIDGPTWTTVQMNPYDTCTLTVSTSEGSLPEPIAGGDATGIAEA